MLQNSNGWDGDSAKEGLFSWGKCPKDDSILSKKMLEKYFLKVSGDGKSREDYSYPVARVVDGKPRYDKNGLEAAFAIARGAHTGTVDNSLVEKIVGIYAKEFGEDELPEGMKAIKENESPIQGRVLYRDPNREIFSNEVSWDDATEKERLVDWATDESGHIQKKLLVKWFLDIDGGSGQDALNYRYPVGSIAGGQPVYDVVGIDHSWDLAAGKKTGIANRMIQKKIIFLKRREKFPLTEEQLDFVSRHMTSGDFTKQDSSGNIEKTYSNELRTASVYKGYNDNFYVLLNNDIKLNAIGRQDALNVAYEFARSGKPNITNIELNSEYEENDEYPGYMKLNEDNTIVNNDIKYNNVAHYGKVIVETDDYIDIPVIPMREGVFIGTDGVPTLKKYEEFSKDAHWLEGQPILHGHTRPNEIVTYKHDRIGKLWGIQPRPETRDVYAIARYWKGKISPEKLNEIRSGHPYDGSIAYTCETVPEQGVYNGEKYNAVEKTGYHFYHFAEVGEGACSVEKGCGFNLNSTVNNDNDGEFMTKDDVKENACSSKKKGAKKEMAEYTEEDILVVDENGNECMNSELVDGMCPVKEGETEEIEETEEVKENSSKSVSVEVKIPDEFMTKLNSIVDDNIALKEEVANLSTKIGEFEIKINGAYDENEVKENSAPSSEEIDDYNAFYARLNASAQPEAVMHYNAFKEQGWTYFTTHSDVFKTDVPEQKLMGVPSRSVVDDRQAERARLRRTLGRKK